MPRRGWNSAQATARIITLPIRLTVTSTQCGTSTAVSYHQMPVPAMPALSVYSAWSPRSVAGLASFQATRVTPSTVDSASDTPSTTSASRKLAASKTA